MKSTSAKLRPVFALAMAFPALVMLVPGPAHAYIGPGAGLSAIGAALALVAAIGLAAVGFVWYPVKRLLRRRADPAARGEDGEDVDDSRLAEDSRPVPPRS